MSSLIEDPAQAAQLRRVERFLASEESYGVLPVSLAVRVAVNRIVHEARAQRLARAAGLPLPPARIPPFNQSAFDVAQAFQHVMEKRNGGPLEEIPLHLIAMRSLVRDPSHGTVRVAIAASDYASRRRNRWHAIRAAHYRNRFLKAR